MMPFRLDTKLSGLRRSLLVIENYRCLVIWFVRFYMLFWSKWTHRIELTTDLLKISGSVNPKITSKTWQTRPPSTKKTIIFNNRTWPNQIGNFCVSSEIASQKTHINNFTLILIGSFSRNRYIRPASAT